jgi:recombination protein RecT
MSTENTEEKIQPLTLSDRLRSAEFKERIKEALGNKANVEEFLSNTLIEISKSDDLKACTWDSIMQCAIDAANFGLIPNKQLGHAYLIAYNNYNPKTKTSTKECQLQIGYKGYVKKFAEYGMSVEVETVTNEETGEGRFEEHRGTNPRILHRPLRQGMRTRDNIAIAYAIGMMEGRRDIMAVLSVEEINEISKTEVFDAETRKRVNKQKGVWVSDKRATDFGEMCKKTAIRRLAKISSIDVVNKMSSYEGERDSKALKDVTPEKEPANQDLKNAILNNSAPALEHKKPIVIEPKKEPEKVASAPKHSAPPAQPASSTPLLQPLAKVQITADELIDRLNAAFDIEEVNSILSKNKEAAKSFSSSEMAAFLDAEKWARERTKSVLV